MTGIPLRLRDRDIIQDQEHRVFVTIGHIQPVERVICYLKYVPDPNGKWVSRGVHYRRVFTGRITSISQNLGSLPEGYLIDDPHLGAVLPEVPKKDISVYYSPEQRLREILNDGPFDSLEATAQMIAEALHDYVGINMRYLGITGSIAWRAHSPQFSDVNLNVYGFSNAWLLQNEFEALNEHPKLRLCTRSDWSHSLARLHSRIPMLESKEICRLFGRRNALCYDRFRVTPTPVLLPDEAPILYGSESYSTISSEPVTIRFLVDDDSYGLFVPSLLGGKSDPVPEIGGNNVTRVMIYDGIFRALIRNGDEIEVTGSLQQITRPDDPDFCEYQIMVGTQRGAGREYVRLR